MSFKNHDQWLFTKEDLYDTPSILDGISFEQEQTDRVKGCHYLLAVGAKLNLPQLVMVTATTFFHRFFMRQSMKRFHVYDIAATSLFVATKVEECTRRMKDIVTACAQKAQKNDKLSLEEDSKQAHTSLCQIEAQLQSSLGSPLCVLYKPNLVAAAALLLASHFTTSEKLNENWYESLQDVDASEMHELASEMLEYYMEHYLVKSSHHPSSQTSSPYPHHSYRH
ncbi:cyclin-like protein [Rhizopus microsporus]|uniref:Cyclin-like protein n=1 Tax=Rhizopus microsporus TaxID=58291 RepID=A0A1X0SGJ3_RHIZD|nr:cyclin-like protein [Rhizopus microsporus]